MHFGFISVWLISGCSPGTPSNSNKVASNQISISKEVPSSTSSLMNNKIERVDPKTVVGNHHFDGADSIWRDGIWYDSTTGLSDLKFVMAEGTGGNGPFIIIVYNVNRAPYEEGIEWVNYPCPRKIQHVTITDITNDGNIVHFNSSNGDIGTLNLQTHEWDFSK